MSLTPLDANINTAKKITPNAVTKTNRTEDTLLLCMGTRPEIIKMMPVYRALKKAGISVSVLHTGQHQDMADDLYSLFDMQPAIRLHLHREDNALASLSATLMAQMGQALQKQQPRAVLVHGDTSSALIAALCAFYRQIPIGHVEAGLRTHQIYDPFPEEKNRELISRLAHWHFCPTAQAAQNLYDEGLRERIVITGNTVMDAVLQTAAQQQLDPAIPRELQTLPTALARLESNDQRILLITAHRRENWGQGLENIMTAALRWLRLDPDCQIIWPVHPNPQVTATLHTQLAKEADPNIRQRVHLMPPLGYESMVWLLDHAWMVATDSGGIQEEASAFGKRVLVLRETTERPEIIESGLGQLTGTQPDALVAALQQAYHQDKTYGQVPLCPHIPSPFGDGTAGERISLHLIRDLQLEPLKNCKHHV